MINRLWFGLQWERMIPWKGRKMRVTYEFEPEEKATGSPAFWGPIRVVDAVTGIRMSPRWMKKHFDQVADIISQPPDEEE